MNISMHRLEQQVTQMLQSVGLSDCNSAITARALVTTDSMGVFTHGTKLLAGYLRKLKGGGYGTQAQPEIVRQGPGWAVIDGNSCLGQVGCDFAMNVAIEKASKVGIAYVGLRNAGHIGAAGYFAAQAARKGFIAMIVGNDIPSVAAPGSKKAVLGSNPLAYSVPVPNRDPILLDIATAAVAGGKVYAATQRGEKIPDTWLIDRNGLPTSDGKLYPDNAYLAPMAGHKGYGLGLWCEVLSGLVPGGHLTWQVGSWMFDPADRPSWHNAGIIVMDTNTIADSDQYSSKLRSLIDEIHAAPTAQGVEQVLLPGEREWNNLRKAEQSGINLPEDVIEKLQQAAELTGVDFD
ncbi:MAG: Ldh family oxidoreductase [Pirellulales bacterium]